MSCQTPLQLLLLPLQLSNFRPEALGFCPSLSGLLLLLGGFAQGPFLFGIILLRREAPDWGRRPFLQARPCSC